jgi:hypothetical protein
MRWSGSQNMGNWGAALFVSWWAEEKGGFMCLSRWAGKRLDGDWYMVHVFESISGLVYMAQSASRRIG